MKPKESDWKKFKDLIPLMRDRFLLRKNEELIAVLSQEGKTPTEIFWETKERLDEYEKIIYQCFRYQSRSDMWLAVLSMRTYCLMLDEDLEQFSEPLRQDIQRVAAVNLGG